MFHNSMYLGTQKFKSIIPDRCSLGKCINSIVNAFCLRECLNSCSYIRGMPLGEKLFLVLHKNRHVEFEIGHFLIGDLFCDSTVYLGRWFVTHFITRVLYEIAVNPEEIIPDDVFCDVSSANKASNILKRMRENTYKQHWKSLIELHKISNKNLLTVK